MEECLSVTGSRVLSRDEIAFLRRVVKEGLADHGAGVCQRQVEAIAREVLNAYWCGVSDGTLLIEIARAASSRSAVHHWCDHSGREKRQRRGPDREFGPIRSMAL